MGTARFEVVDKLLQGHGDIHGKAYDFYGMGPLVSVPTQRFRTLHKALGLIPDLDDNSKKWMERFHPEKMAALGDIALKDTVTIPTKEKPEDFPEKFQTLSTHEVLKLPGIRDVLFANLRAREDPAGHIAEVLVSWQQVQHPQPPDYEITSANRVLEQFIFGVHGHPLREQLEETIIESRLNGQTQAA